MSQAAARGGSVGRKRKKTGDEEKNKLDRFFDELDAFHSGTGRAKKKSSKSFDAKKLFGKSLRFFDSKFDLNLDLLPRADDGSSSSGSHLDLFYQYLSQTQLVDGLVLLQQGFGARLPVPLAEAQRVLCAIAENPFITYLNMIHLRFAPSPDSLSLFFTNTEGLTDLKINVGQFGSDIADVATTSAALGANKTLQCLVLMLGEDGELLECVLSGLGSNSGILELELYNIEYKCHLRGMTGFLAATKSLTTLRTNGCRFHSPSDNMKCLVDGLTANESLQKLTFERCIMGQEAVRDLVAYMQSPVALHTDGTATSSIQELYFRMEHNPFHRAGVNMSSVAKAIFTIPRGQETTIACHNLRVFDCQRQYDLANLPFKNFNGFFYVLGTKASILRLQRFRAAIVSPRALHGLCGLIPKLVRLQELAIHFCNADDDTPRDLEDDVLQETVRRKLVKALRRNGSIHTVQLERHDMGSGGPSSYLGRLGNAYLERNRRIPQMLAAPPRFNDAAEVSDAVPSSEHATVASLFPALFQCSSKAPNMTPKNVLSGLRSFGDRTGPDGPGKRVSGA